MKYDVLVVGAGPAGLFPCYELIKRSKGMKIALVEMGKSMKGRKRSDV